jgi:hypothetical protein
MLALVALSVLNILVYLGIVFFTMQGSVCDEAPRHHVRTFIHCKGVLLILDCALAVLGQLLASSEALSEQSRQRIRWVATPFFIYIGCQVVGIAVCFVTQSSRSGEQVGVKWRRLL